MAIIDGNAQGVDDILVGSAEDDRIQGFSGDDLLNGARGDDTLIGGPGSDVMSGGLDSDTFVWSAGHLTEAATDYVRDFSLSQGDKLQFLDSGNGQVFEVLSILIQQLSETSFNGFDLHNGNAFDIVFEVRNSETGKTQEIALLDTWSQGSNDAWVDYLATLGLEFT